ncbi:MAG: hypothetical protein LBK75_07025 [Oscillospiraceae bacterium]|jgi:hypothetical protein|nr:hypothetical protein [Oscillospiraceae bacterium]
MKYQAVLGETYTQSERSILRLGGLLTAVVALLYVTVTVMIAVDPVGMYIAGGEGFGTLLHRPYINIIWRLLFAVLYILNIAVVVALNVYVGKGNERHAGVLTWSKICMLFGLLLGAANWVHFVEVTRVMLQQYAAGFTLEEITAPHYFPLDPYFLWTWGLFGVGYLATNLVALRSNRFSRKQCILGIVASVQCIVLVLSYISQIAVSIAGMSYSLMMLVAGTLGGVTGPLYCFGCRKYFRAAAQASASEEREAAAG